MTTHATQTTRHALTALALAGAIAPLTGCINDANGRLTLGPEDGPSVALAAFDPYVTPGELAALAVAEPAIPTHRAEPPSVLGLDRSNWSPQAFLVPVDTTAHAPHYRWSHGTAATTPRERGEFPTTADALGPSSEHPDRDWREAPAAPGWAIIEAVAMPVRLFLSPPCETRLSPSWSYERRPRVLHTLEYAPIPADELNEVESPQVLPGPSEAPASEDRFVPIEPSPVERVRPRGVEPVRPVPTEPTTPPLPEPEPAEPGAAS